MVYESFLQTITSALQARLGSSYSIVMHKIPKNNGIMLDSICISKDQDSIAPVIYLNSYYEQFLDGMPLEDILIDIEQFYTTNSTCPSLTMDHFCNFSDISHKIAWKLIHSESNQELLTQIPHIPLLDLAVVFYLYLEQSERGQMTALIYNEHLVLWELRMEELVQLAKTNTPRLLPVTINHMRDVMKELAKNSLGEDYNEAVMDCLLDKNENEDLYVMTNTSGLYGASCILYEDVLNQFAGMVDSDLIILPSSIHEVLLLPDSGDISYEELTAMVLHINQTEVPMEDRLSNQIYRYTRDYDCIDTISSASNLSHTTSVTS